MLRFTWDRCTLKYKEKSFQEIASYRKAEEAVIQKKNSIELKNHIIRIINVKEHSS